MNKIDVVEILKTINMYYPSLKTGDLEKTADAWLKILKTEDKNLILKNLEEHVKTDHYPPTIADLLKVPKERGRYIPNVEETKKMLKEMENRTPATKEEKEKALAEIKKTLEKQGAKL